MSNKCKVCGSDVQIGEKFCGSCGSAIQSSDNNNSNKYNQNMTTGKTTGKAVASLICGIVGLFFAGIIMGIISMSLGVTALNHIKIFPQDKGKGLAIAGIVLGTINLILGVIAIVIKSFA